MRRLLAALVLTLMVLPALAMLIPSTEAQAITDQSGAIGKSFTDANGITMHLMTYAGMLELRQKVGIRVDGVNYDAIVDGYHTGLAPPSSESWESMVGNVFLAQTPMALTLSAPSAYDMSTNSWFPTVGNQGGQGSCAAWAATYYCYGAVEAKDNGWTGSKSGNSAQLLSPAWTYNRVTSRGLNGGSWMSENFEVIKDWGVSTMATFPYTDSNDVNWGGEAAWRNAPLHRGSELVFLDINDGTINAIKNLVSADQPVTFAIDSYQFHPSLDDDFVITADEYDPVGDLNHAQTIVGYNDSKVIDGHSDIGAFRIVNSWGAGWKDGGYYWISYDAFKEIMNENGNELCYITDIPNYVPSLLAIWHFNNPPKRNVEHNLTIGNPSSCLDFKVPYWCNDPTNVLPSFMICDISEFRPYYDSGTIRFNLAAVGGTASVISSFRIESYENGYSPGAPTQVSAQSSQVPKTTPGRLENDFPRYLPITPAQALDCEGIEVSSPSSTDWVGVEQSSVYGGSAMQAGDVGDSYSSTIQINVTGYSGVSFFWKVSSEQSADFLRFYDSAMKKMEISGESEWRQVWYGFTDQDIHTLKWSYEKNTAISSGQDGAWIDRLQLLQSGMTNDSMPPITQVSCRGDVGSNGWYNSAVSVVLTPNDLWSVVNETKYWVDSSPWMNYDGAFQISTDGRHVVSVYSTDYAGNVEAVKSITVMIDMSDPVLSSNLIGTKGSNDWFTSGVRISINASDEISGVHSIIYRLDGSADKTYCGEINVSKEGTHSLNYYSVDVAGNTGIGHSIDFMIDTVAPHSSASLNGSLGDGGWYTSPVDLTVNTNDNISGALVTYMRVNDGDWCERSNGHFGDGVYRVEFYSIDNAGNCEPIQSLMVKSDLDMPSTSHHDVGTLAESGWFTSDVSMNLTAEDTGSAVKSTVYRIDGGNWTTYDGNILFDDEGVHLIEYQSLDLAGNQEPLRSSTIKLDKTVPISSAHIQGNEGMGGWYNSGLLICINASDSVSGIATQYYRLDTGDWHAYSEQIMVDSNGTHLLEFYSQDRAGNIEPVERLELRIDNDIPTIATNIEGRIFTTSEVSLNWTTEDNTSDIGLIELSIDGQSYQMLNGSQRSITLHGLADGSHSLEIRVTDFSGNQAVSELNFTVDTNALSPQGPYGLTLLICLVVIVVATVAVGILRFRRR